MVRAGRAGALGTALSFGNNKSLVNLKLDYNATIGHEGATLLCRGLRTNSTLKVSEYGLGSSSHASWPTTPCLPCMHPWNPPQTGVHNHVRPPYCP